MVSMAYRNTMVVVGLLDGPAYDFISKLVRTSWFMLGDGSADNHKLSGNTFGAFFMPTRLIKGVSFSIVVE